MHWLNKLLVLILVSSFSVNTFGVQLSSSHQGGSVFIPLYSAENGNGSALTVTNNGTDASAFKILFQNQVGTTVAGINLYMPEMDTWVMFISSDEQGVIVSIPDSTCTAPYLYESDDPSAALSLPAIGQILITDMGEVTGNTEIALAIDHETLLPRNCDLINNNWAPDGIWNTEPGSDILPPTEDLRAELQIVNVNEGTIVTVPGLVLADFSDILLHTSPAEFLPDLSSVNSDDSSFENGAKSFVESSIGQFIEDDWPYSIDAISVLLATRNLNSAFSAENSIGATAEWVLAFPTLEYYEVEGSSKDFSNAKISYRSTDRNTKRVFDCDPSIVLKPCPPDGEFTLRDNLVAIGSSTASQMGVAEFYGGDGHTLVEAGQFQIGLNHNPELNFFSSSGAQYFGLPVYAFAIQKFINGHLTGLDGQTVLANYRTHIEITLDKFQLSSE